MTRAGGGVQEERQSGTRAGGAAPSSLRRRWLRRAARVALVVVALLVALVGTGWLWLSHTVTNYAGARFNHGDNAVWIEHTWAGDPHSADAYAALAAQLSREQVHYVFVHVGPLDSDGTIPADRFRFAATLVKTLKQDDPGVQVLAWIGQLERASGYPPDETVDLSNPGIRQAIATTAAYFARPLGFDGVQYDIEPMPNNSPHLLDLLDVTRSLLPPGKMLSISTPMWAPNAHAAEWLRSTVGKGAGLWTSYYYADVAKHVDQMVVMEYNTAIPFGPLYSLYVKQQTQHILAAARTARHQPEVLIGLPTYHENGFWFHDGAENLQYGLSGVISGLNSDTTTRPFTGVAVYRLATTAQPDWQTYDRLWLGR